MRKPTAIYALTEHGIMPRRPNWSYGYARWMSGQSRDAYAKRWVHSYWLPTRTLHPLLRLAAYEQHIHGASLLSEIGPYLGLFQP